METLKVAPETEQPTLVMQGLPPVQARRVMVASVHFEPREARFWHSNRRLFRIEPAPKGGITYLPVYDSQQWVAHAEALDQEMSKVPLPVPVETIARDLVDQWGWVQLNRTANFRIGIDIIAGDEATPAEKQALIDKEERMCRAAVEEADRFHQSGKGEITAYHRKCLDWLGSEKRDWYNEIRLGKTKVGPLSGQRIPMEALADGPHDLLKWYAGNGLDPMDFGDVYISELLKKKPHLRKAEMAAK